VAVAIGLDRTSAPMVEDRPAVAPPKPERKRRRPRLRRAPPPYDINWRMAYVGTVCFVEALRTPEPPTRKRLRGAETF
jgi:hypothetical protein